MQSVQAERITGGEIGALTKVTGFALLHAAGEQEETGFSLLPKLPAGCTKRRTPKDCIYLRLQAGAGYTSSLRSPAPGKAVVFQIRQLAGWEVAPRLPYNRACRMCAV